MLIVDVMKLYRYKYQSLGFDIIKPIVPRMDALDGIGSLLNITGNYYPILPMIEDVREVSKKVSTASSAWEKIYGDINKSIIDFSSIHKLPQPTLPTKYPTLKIDMKSWKMY